MAFGEKHSCFGYLPPEVVFDVMNCLGLVDKKNCRLVCNRWRAILETLFTETLVFRLILTNRSFSGFFKSNLKMDRVTMRGVTKIMAYMTTAKNQFPYIREVVIGHGNSQASICDLFKYGLQQTESLILDGCSFMKEQHNLTFSEILRESQWNHLLELELRVLSSDRKDMKTSTIFLKLVKIPNLRDFTLTFRAVQDQTNQMKIKIRNFFIFIYTFITRHVKLTKLTYDISSEGGSWSSFNILKIPKYTPGQPICTKMKIQTCTLIWNDSSADMIHRFNGLEYLVSPILIGSELKDFTIEATSNKFPYGIDVCIFKQIFNEHSKTLEKLFFRSCVVKPSWLRNCKLLKSLIFDECFLNVPLADVEGGLLSLPCLNTLKIQNEGRDCSVFSQQRLISQVGRSIEKLEFLLRPCPYSTEIDWGWLNSCYTLKYLDCTVTRDVNLASNNQAFFPNMIEFKIQSVERYRTQDDIFIWIVRSMPNLETLNMIHFGITSLYLQQLFDLRKVEKIYLDAASCENKELIKEFYKNKPYFYKTRKVYAEQTEPTFFIHIDRSKCATVPEFLIFENNLDFCITYSNAYSWT